MMTEIPSGPVALEGSRSAKIEATGIQNIVMESKKSLTKDELNVIEAMQTENKPLSELSNIMTVYPQALINVEVHTKPVIESVPPILEAVRSVESDLGEQGRVLVRYSGTQPLCRVMVEGPDESKTRGYCEQIADIISNSIGAE